MCVHAFMRQVIISKHHRLLPRSTAGAIRARPRGSLPVPDAVNKRHTGRRSQRKHDRTAPQQVRVLAGYQRAFAAGGGFEDFCCGTTPTWHPAARSCCTQRDPEASMWLTFANANATFRLFARSGFRTPFGHRRPLNQRQEYTRARTRRAACEACAAMRRGVGSRAR